MRASLQFAVTGHVKLRRVNLGIEAAARRPVCVPGRRQLKVNGDSAVSVILSSSLGAVAIQQPHNLGHIRRCVLNEKKRLESIRYGGLNAEIDNSHRGSRFESARPTTCRRRPASDSFSGLCLKVEQPGLGLPLVNFHPGQSAAASTFIAFGDEFGLSQILKIKPQEESCTRFETYLAPLLQRTQFCGEIENSILNINACIRPFCPNVLILMRTEALPGSFSRSAGSLNSGSDRNYCCWAIRRWLCGWPCNRSTRSSQHLDSPNYLLALRQNKVGAGPFALHLGNEISPISLARPHGGRPVYAGLGLETVGRSVPASEAAGAPAIAAAQLDQPDRCLGDVLSRLTAILIGSVAIDLGQMQLRGFPTTALRLRIETHCQCQPRQQNNLVSRQFLIHPRDILSGSAIHLEPELLLISSTPVDCPTGTNIAIAVPESWNLPTPLQPRAHPENTSPVVSILRRTVECCPLSSQFTMADPPRQSASWAGRTMASSYSAGTD
ncbi:uncharacterized protein BO95DRAFT_493196 [Aspergillus brunneoviolaceus CBS 621.78]|uniref:Uncharacterized protein n=1 Tax=Aspergillus brunneoviolaceus CBS 621.78 TaxID=1450534 RepID=A0ACD1GDQ0_9EURO|nr:hypothetical protein BO95DRAFT_493196 [Aspergillus brunneoviolaceus CBS 621.78]RAH47368.1 hypothetical protein BO95DRAFT_493196 [Aspergillus brunneoviolaceus CBS 621.78]